MPQNSTVAFHPISLWYGKNISHTWVDAFFFFRGGKTVNSRPIHRCLFIFFVRSCSVPWGAGAKLGLCTFPNTPLMGGCANFPPFDDRCGFVFADRGVTWPNGAKDYSESFFLFRLLVIFFSLSRLSRVYYWWDNEAYVPVRSMLKLPAFFFLFFFRLIGLNFFFSS